MLAASTPSPFLSLLSAAPPPPSPVVFAALEEGYGLLPSPSPEASPEASPSPSPSPSGEDDVTEEVDDVDVSEEEEAAAVAPAPAPEAEGEDVPSAEPPAPAPLPTDYVPSSPSASVSGIELSVSSQDDYYRILRFSGESRRIEAVYVNGVAAELDDSQNPVGWVLSDSEGLDLATPIQLDLYDEEDNKVYVPLASLTSQNLQANFGGDVEGAPEDGRGYYIVDEE